MKYSGVLILLTLTFIGASKIKKASKSEDGNNILFYVKKLMLRELILLIIRGVDKAFIFII